MNGNLFEMNASSDGEWFTAHCDGGSRGNPGPSGYGAVVEDAQGSVVAELSEYLGKQTNNYAEYHGLLAALKWSLENGVKRLRVISDSELMVKQMKGLYKVNSPGLRPLWEEAKSLSRRFERFEMRHTLRGGNKEADRLANEAMDRGMGRAVGGASEPAIQQVSKPADRQIGRTAVSAAHCAAPAPAAKPTRQILEGYVKDGVVHLLGGELPDGIFVKILRE
jgi:ribonuclease HI